MNPLARQLAELKYALQELESAVQQPQEDKFGVEQILDRFPSVLTLIVRTLADALKLQGIKADTSTAAITEAHSRGWLKGDKALWLRLLADQLQIETPTSDAGARAVAQDVRACSWMLWETYELLTARFRWQTQVNAAAKPVVAPAIPAQRFAAL